MIKWSNLWWRSHLFAGWEISQQCSTRLTALLLSTLGSAKLSRFFMFFSCWKWKLISVAKTMSITSERNSRNSSRDRFWRILHSSSLNILKKKYTTRISNVTCRIENFYTELILYTWSSLIYGDFLTQRGRYREVPYHSPTSRGNCLWSQCARSRE